MSIKELKKKGFQLRTIHELIPKLYERIEELQSERHQSSIQVKLQPQLQNHSTEIPKRTSIVFQTETQRYTEPAPDKSAGSAYAELIPDKPMPITPQEDEPGVKPGVTPATIDPADKPIVEEPEVEPFPVTQPLTAPTHEDKADTFRTIMRRLIGDVKKERQQDQNERLQTEEHLHEQSQRMVAAAIEQEKLPEKRRWFSRKSV